MTYPIDDTYDLSQITEYLYISAWPVEEHREHIINQGIRLILSMHWRKPAKNLNEPPLELLWLPTFDNPLFPMPMSVFFRGVNKARSKIINEEPVLVHCVAGKHRSVAMACCILISTGVSAQTAMNLVKEKRSIADPDVWYIRSRINKFEQEWKSRSISQ